MPRLDAQQLAHIRATYQRYLILDAEAAAGEVPAKQWRGHCQRRRNLSCHMGEAYVGALLEYTAELRTVIAQLLDGIIAWSADEDGTIHDAALQPFKDAAILIGLAIVPLPDDHREAPFRVSPAPRDWLHAHEAAHKA